MLKVESLPKEDRMSVDDIPTETNAVGGATMDDLFGDENTEVVEEQRGEMTPKDEEEDEEEPLTKEELNHRNAMEYAEVTEDENDPEEIHLREAAVSIPNIPKIRSSDGQYWVLRLPNFVKLDSRAFHPQTYIGPEHHEEEGTAGNVRERSMSIKLQVENTIRWRWTKDKEGNDVKQSNCRVIRWSDGSQTLLLGKEQFEIIKNVDTSTSAQMPSPSKDAKPPTRAQGLTYLVAQHARSTILQAEAPITGTFTLRPMGMQSETHRMLVRAVGQKHNRVARLRMAPDPIRDPEREKMELLKTQAKKPRKRKERDEDGIPSAARRRSGFLKKRTSERLWSDEEEEEEAYGSEGSDEERRVPRTPRTGGKHTGEYQTDDFVVSDEEEEGGEGVTGKRKKRRESEEGPRDSLDEMDEKIEADERRRKKRGGETDGKDVVKPLEEEGEPEKDIESEEEEEEEVIRVRRPTRPKVIVEEEDEE